MKQWQLIIGLLYVLSSNLWGKEVILDNKSEGFKIVSGKWNPSTRDKNFEGESYLWSNQSDGEGKVTWTYQPEKKGSYQVLAKWVGSKPTDRANDASYQISSGNTDQKVKVDMTKKESWGQWNNLGVFTFDNNASITLTNLANNSVVADAIKIIYMGEDMNQTATVEKLIFEDGFDAKNENWVVEQWKDEEAKITWENSQLKVETYQDKAKKVGTDGVMIWLNKELPKNFKFEYDVTPTSESGFFLIFFCIKCQDGKDILDPDVLKAKKAATLFKKYVSSDIDGYHISYRRNEVANCNFRKNSGMTLLHQTTLDKIMSKDKTVHVVLTKHGGKMKLIVDDTVFMEIEDNGTKNGKVREGGKIGFRQVYNSTGNYDNVKLYDLGE